jgi:phage recombination protein Bet
MSNELVKSNNATSLELVSKETLVKYLDTAGLATKLTDKEKESFIEISVAYGLNPFKREIHASVYGEGQYRQVSFITGYEVYLKRAERTGLLDGWKAETFGSVKNGDLKAVVTIYRKDRSHPFVWEAHYDECKQTKKDGTVTAFWQKANFMTKKVAISQGFRLCFSDELGGMPYTADEMPQYEDTSYSVVQEEPKVIEAPKKAPSEKELQALCKRITSGQFVKKDVIDNAKLHFTLSESDLKILEACVYVNEKLEPTQNAE